MVLLSLIITSLERKEFSNERISYKPLIWRILCECRNCDSRIVGFIRSVIHSYTYLIASSIILSICQEIYNITFPINNFFCRLQTGTGLYRVALSKYVIIS